MRLIECYIENFGKLTKKKVDFKDGLNCIKDDNGSGKTTLAAFIKVMLYGMSDTKKQSLDDNDRKHYLPWNGSSAGGSLTFEAGGRIYRAERSFAQKAADDTLTVYDTSTGRAVDYFNEGLGEALFGIDADGFERTVFLSERALTPKSDNKSISAKLSDLVGCDGDIGGMDDAMETLEKERKFYQKRGGSGELADTKAKIDEINRRLSALGEAERALEAARARMTAITGQITEAKAKSAQLMKEREDALLKAAEVGYDKQYADLKSSIEEAIRRRSETAEIFGERIPTFADIDDASYKATEARNLKVSIEESQQTIEFRRLSERFDGVVDRARIERAKVAIEEIKAHEARLNDPRVERAKRLFKGRIPKEREIEEIEALVTAGKDRTPIWALIIYIISLLAVIVGLGIMMPLAIGAGIVLIITAIIDFATKSKKANDRQKKVEDFFLSVSKITVDDEEEAIDRLREMQTSLDILASICGDTEEQTEVLEGLVSLFTDGRGGDLVRSAENIIAEFERYAELSVAERYIMGERRVRGERAEKMSGEAMLFLSRFDTKTSDPFGELRQALTEYNRLSAEILARQDQLARLENQKNLGESNHKLAMAEVADIDVRRRQNEEAIANLEREYALTERAYSSYCEELEMREELTMRLSELEEALARHKDNYETILLTKKYITLAKDNMSARYLGKTKAGFIKYAGIIGGLSDENYEMDTDFGITKQEGATTRSVEAYSRGTRDLYNLAARFALVDSLYEKEKPFIILDDPFTAFDDTKTTAALKLLREFAKERQIIYFTCAKSRSI